MLIKQKYRFLFSPKRVGRPGPKGPTKALIDAVMGELLKSRGNRSLIEAATVLLPPI
jgi:hypothetical protein